MKTPEFLAYKASYARKWNREHPEEAKKYRYAWKLRNPARTMLSQAKGRAKKSGLDFDITLEDVVVPELCPYLKMALVPGHREWAPSLDRIDNTKGYVKGNIQVISVKANQMKNTATKEQLETFARSILKIG